MVTRGYDRELVKIIKGIEKIKCRIDRDKTRDHNRRVRKRRVRQRSFTQASSKSMEIVSLERYGEQKQQIG